MHIYQLDNIHDHAHIRRIIQSCPHQKTVQQVFTGLNSNGQIKLVLLLFCHFHNLTARNIY